MSFNSSAFAVFAGCATPSCPPPNMIALYRLNLAVVNLNSDLCTAMARRALIENTFGFDVFQISIVVVL